MADDPTSITQWLQSLPISWLVGGANGRNEAGAIGEILDDEVALLKEATKARFPSIAPADALPVIGGDRVLLRGPSETDAHYRLRLKYAWQDWARAGTFLELLVQLWYAGFENAVIAQQNGMVFGPLGGAPTPGADPTGLMPIQEPTTINVLTSMTLPTQPNVPAGSTWWTIDQSTEFGSRFVVLFPSTATWLSYTAIAFFDTTDPVTLGEYAVATWNKPFDSASYNVLVSAFIPDDVGSPGNHYAWADGTTQTATSITVRLSEGATGTVKLLGWPDGVNPIVNLSAVGLGNLESIIQKWRPARATCAGVYALEQGRYFGYPPRTFDDGPFAGGTFGPSSVIPLVGKWS